MNAPSTTPTPEQLVSPTASENSPAPEASTGFQPLTDATLPSAEIVGPSEPLPDGSADALAAAPGPASGTKDASLGVPPHAPHAPTNVMPASPRETFDTLAATVLDAADVATQSATTVTRFGMDLKSATDELRALTDTLRKRSLIILGISSVLMLIGLTVMVATGVRMSTRISELDAMLLAVGKRAVELNASVQALDATAQQFKDVSKTISALSEAQQANKAIYEQLEDRITGMIKQAESSAQKVPAMTAKQVADSSEALLKQVQALNSRVQSQGNTVQALHKELKALSGTVTNVDALKRDVQALVILQRERYLETLQRSQSRPAPVRDPAVQYPRSQVPTDEGPTSRAMP